jgi:hypothetical protein
MNLALWIVAGLLAFAYLMSGGSKMLVPREKMAKKMRGAEWVMDFSPGALKAIGAVEVLGAIGLILPALLGIAPILVPLAAIGLVLVMIGAVIVRIRRREFTYALMDLVYLALSAFVAFGRLGPAPFTG